MADEQLMMREGTKCVVSNRILEKYKTFPKLAALRQFSVTFGLVTKANEMFEFCWPHLLRTSYRRLNYVTNITFKAIIRRMAKMHCTINRNKWLKRDTIVIIILIIKIMTV